MYWIAITGGIASGKSSLCQYLQKLNYMVLSADAIAHDLLDNDLDVKQSLQQVFGDEILSHSEIALAKIHRSVLAKKVFHEPEKRKILEAILHPKIHFKAKQMRALWLSQGLELAFYEIPLLFETKQEAQFDKIVLLASSEQTQLKRMIEERSFSVEDAKARIEAQIPLKNKINKAHYVIQNDKTKLDFEVACDEFLTKLKSDLNLK